MFKVYLCYQHTHTPLDLPPPSPILDYLLRAIIERTWIITIILSNYSRKYSLLPQGLILPLVECFLVLLPLLLIQLVLLLFNFICPSAAPCVCVLVQLFVVHEFDAIIICKWAAISLII